MYEGKIIKFYREKYQMTQEQLGKGICSGTHISKIERIQTEYSPEIITLLADRLGINIDQETAKLHSIKKRLNHWQEVIIMQLFEEMDSVFNQLEHEELIQISEYINLYKLLKARYFLMKNLMNESTEIIEEIQKVESKLTPYEKNLLKHVIGIYYLSKHDYLNALKYLKEIQDEIYNNPEYYYHLAHAYHTIESPVMAYFYADKSRQFFKQINSYLRVIDAEMIMIIQVKDDEIIDSSETIKKFESLIQSSDLCNAPDRKAKLLHNLAYEYFRRNEFKLASKYYKESMSLKNNQSGPYLLSLEGYIRSSYEGNLQKRSDLLQLAEEGLQIASENNHLLYIKLFTLLTLFIQSKEQEYYQFLIDEALPMYKKYGFSYLIQHSKKALFNYYSKIKLTNKALEMASQLIDT